MILELHAKQLARRNKFLGNRDVVFTRGRISAGMVMRGHDGFRAASEFMSSGSIEKGVSRISLRTVALAFYTDTR